MGSRENGRKTSRDRATDNSFKEFHSQGENKRATVGEGGGVKRGFQTPDSHSSVCSEGNDAEEGNVMTVEEGEQQPPCPRSN